VAKNIIYVETVCCILLGMSVNIDAAILFDTGKASTIDIVSTDRCIALFNYGIKLLSCIG
jgi:hypothetical protein